MLVCINSHLCDIKWSNLYILTQIKGCSNRNLNLLNQLYNPQCQWLTQQTQHGNYHDPLYRMGKSAWFVLFFKAFVNCSSANIPWSVLQNESCLRGLITATVAHAPFPVVKISLLYLMTFRCSLKKEQQQQKKNPTQTYIVFTLTTVMVCRTSNWVAGTS